MAQVVEHHQPAARDVGRQAPAVGQRDQPVLPAPQDQRRRGDTPDMVHALGGRPVLQPLHQGGPVAGAQRQFEVAVDQRAADLRRVAVDRAQALRHQRPWQKVFAQVAQQRQAGKLPAQRQAGAGHRIGQRIDQHQLRHPLRRQQRQMPGHAAAQRVAGHHEARHRQPVQQVEHEAGVGLAAVGLAGRPHRIRAGKRPGQAEAWQVQADHPALVGQRLGPALPGVQAGRGAVQQHDGHRVAARADVAVVHQLAVQVDELRGRRRPARHQRLDRPVGRLQQRQRQRRRQQQQAEQSQQQRAHGRGG